VSGGGGGGRGGCGDEGKWNQSPRFVRQLRNCVTFIGGRFFFLFEIRYTSFLVPAQIRISNRRSSVVAEAFPPRALPRISMRLLQFAEE